MNKKVAQARRVMQQATDYASWHDAACELDRYEGLEDWKEDDISSDFDYRLIRTRLNRLRQFRRASDVRRLMYHLRQGLHWNLGNYGSAALYSVSRVGTKQLVEDYIATVVDTLDFLCDTQFDDLQHGEKVQFFRETAKAYGRSGLMLSGGASLGLFHVGVIKALWEQDLLPRVISGSSAGAIVAAGVCTRPESDLEELFLDNGFYTRFWRRLDAGSIRRRGILMDPDQLAAGIAKNIPDLTFEEAVSVSKRNLNITVSPARANQSPRLLNYLSFPHLYIREAVQASCAVPFVFPPTQLATQNADGLREIFMPSLKWADGSLKSDLPVLRMRRLNNVNHYIVSQTNPHVLPFMTQDTKRSLKLLRTARKFAFSTVKHQSKFALELAKANWPGEGRIGHMVGQAHAVLDQDYRGNVTVMPPFSVKHYPVMLSNLDDRQIRHFIRMGERATWPRISMIKNQICISQTFDRCLERLTQAPAARPTSKAHLRSVR